MIAAYRRTQCPKGHRLLCAVLQGELCNGDAMMTAPQTLSFFIVLIVVIIIFYYWSDVTIRCDVCYRNRPITVSVVVLICQY